MKKLLHIGIALALAASLAGCGGTVTAVSFSDVLDSTNGHSPSDGYVEDIGSAFLAVQLDGIRVQSPFGLSPERRGFVSFSIASIPVGALVNSAQVRLFVKSVIQDSPSTPVFLDVYHVYYGSPLLGSDFLAARTFVTTFTLMESADEGKDLPPFEFFPELQLDVDDSTHGFFQLLLISRNGVVEIEDSENSFLSGFLPQLDVSYFP